MSVYFLPLQLHKCGPLLFQRIGGWRGGSNSSRSVGHLLFVAGLGGHNGAFNRGSGQRACRKMGQWRGGMRA